MSRSKPAVPIAGKYRLIDIPISNCLNSDIRKMFVLTMFNSASLNKHIKNTYNFDMFSNGFVDIMAAEQTRQSQDWFQGTSDAVKKTLPRLQNIDYDYVLILSGDQLYNMDFKSIMEYHAGQNADITIATIPVVAKDATSFGIMKVNGDGWIEDFVEKPPMAEVGKWKSDLPEKYTSKDKDYLASMGIYIFNKEVMNQLFEEQKDATDFGKEIIPYAVNSDKYKVSSYSYDGYWADIGNISAFLEANLELTDYLPAFHLYDNVKKIYTHARMLAPTKIFGTKITHGLISDGCICHAEEITRSVIGHRSRIGKWTVLRGCIVIGNSYYQAIDDIEQLPDNKLLGIGNNCHLENVIVDRNARVGHNVNIIGGAELEDAETGEYCIREGIVIVKQGAYIPSGSSIGISLD
jgi:glucose-1-phosphate adenylyltransferase